MPSCILRLIDLDPNDAALGNQVLGGKMIPRVRNAQGNATSAAGYDSQEALVGVKWCGEIPSGHPAATASSKARRCLYRYGEVLVTTCSHPARKLCGLALRLTQSAGNPKPEERAVILVGLGADQRRDQCNRIVGLRAGIQGHAVVIVSQRQEHEVPVTSPGRNEGRKSSEAPGAPASPPDSQLRAAPGLRTKQANVVAMQPDLRRERLRDVDVRGTTQRRIDDEPQGPAVVQLEAGRIACRVSHIHF
jgi:hypothetical protein